MEDNGRKLPAPDLHERDVARIVPNNNKIVMAKESDFSWVEIVLRYCWAQRIIPRYFLLFIMKRGCRLLAHPRHYFVGRIQFPTNAIPA